MIKYFTPEECFAALNLDINKNIPGTEHLPEADRRPVIVHYIMMKIFEAHNVANKCKKIDYSNLNQVKYSIWWKVKASKEKPAGSGLSYLDFDYSLTLTYVGARLSSLESGIVEHIGETFPDLCAEYLLYSE
jgi:hypothetical protein